MSARTAIVITFMGLGACSLLNREGPTDTCSTLQNGAVNSCKEGIIATCAAGSMTYKVCGDKAACDGSWQTSGQFRCLQSDPHPTTGADGGVPEGGIKPDGGGSCGTGDVCSIADTGGGAIDALATDGTSVYFTDRTTLWSVPSAGGFPSVLGAASSPADSFGYMSTDQQYVYLLRYDENRIARVLRGGGSFQTVATFSYSKHFVADATRVYWFEGAASGPVRALAKAGGSPVTVVTNTNFTTLSVGPGFLYWPGGGGTINRVPTSAVGPTPPTTISVTASVGTGNTVLAVAADDSGLYFSTSASGGAVWTLPTGSSTAVHLADGVGTAGYLGLSDTHVFWVNWEGGFGVVKKVPKDGSSAATVIFKTTDTSINNTRIAADGTYVYWKTGHSLYRAPK